MRDTRYQIQDSWMQHWTLKYFPVSLILLIRHLVSLIWYLVSKTIKLTNRK